MESMRICQALAKLFPGRGPEVRMSLGCSGSSKTSVAGEVCDRESEGREVLDVDRGWIALGLKVTRRILF